MTSVGLILKTVADIRGIAVNDLLSPRRNVAVVRVRQEVMWFAKRQTRQSLPQIGRALGGLDHTTILHGVRATDERISKTVGYGDELEAIGQRIADIDHAASDNVIALSYAPIAAFAVAQRIDQAHEDGVDIALTASEALVLARHVLAAESLAEEKRAAEHRASQAERACLLAEADAAKAEGEAAMLRRLQTVAPAPGRQLIVVAAPAAPAANAEAPTAAIVVQARRVVLRFLAFETDRYGRFERPALDRLIAALVGLKDIFEQGRN